jgi:RNA polymerase sigma-70 factor, ECF subfamily
MEHVEGSWFASVTASMAAPDRMTGVAGSAQAAGAFDARDDAALVGACLGGSREAFDVIVGRHQRSVYQLCYRFMGNHEDASDAAQEVFLRAYRGLKNFKGDAAFATWLYRIGVNACLNRVSIRTPPCVPLESPDVALDRAPDPAGRLLQEERARQVREAIGKLPPKQRATLILRVYQELSHQEIANIVGSSVGAAKANFFHALQNLKRLLGP